MTSLSHRSLRRARLATTTVVATVLVAGHSLGAQATTAPAAGADTSDNTLLAPLHTDMAPMLDSAGEMTVMFHQDDGSNHDPATTIVEVPSTARTTVPAASPGTSYRYAAPVGQDVWVLPEIQDPNLVWLGWSAQRVPSTAYQGQLTMRFEGVTGAAGGKPPGELVLTDSFAPYGAAPLASTREGLPRALSMPANIHKHLNWTFTAPGTYCLGVSAEATMADGHRSSETSVLTFVVGQPPGLDARTVPTCEQQGVRTEGASLVEPDRSREQAPALIQPARRAKGVPGTNAYVTLRPRLTDDELAVDLVEGTQVDGGTAHHPSATVLAVAPESRTIDGDGRPYWDLGAPVSAGGDTTIHYDTTRLGPDDVDGAVTWRLQDVRAPGSFLLTQLGNGAEGRAWSTLAGQESRSFSTERGTGNEITNGRFYADGVYCVAGEVSGSRPDGTAVTATLPLVFAVAVAAPGEVTVDDCGRSAAVVDANRAARTAPVDSRTTASVTRTSSRFGSPVDLDIAVQADAQPVDGAVSVVLDGGSPLTVPLVGGRARTALPRTASAGPHTVTVDYPGGTTTTGRVIRASQVRTSWTVTKAATRASVAVSKHKSRSGRVRATVRLTAVGAAGAVRPTGKVVIYDGRRKIATLRLTARDRGVRTITLRRLSRGKHTIKIAYAGTDDHAKARATKRVRVR